MRMLVPQRSYHSSPFIPLYEGEIERNATFILLTEVVYNSPFWKAKGLKYRTFVLI